MRTAVLQKQLHQTLDLLSCSLIPKHTQWALNEGVSSLEDAVAARVWIVDANLGSTPHTGALSPNVEILAACPSIHTTEGRPHPTPPHHVWGPRIYISS